MTINHNIYKYVYTKWFKLLIAKKIIWYRRGIPNIELFSIPSPIPKQLPGNKTISLFSIQVYILPGISSLPGNLDVYGKFSRFAINQCGEL